MTVKSRGLGRNLSALLGSSHTGLLMDKPSSEHLKLAVHSLQPGKYQPRGEIEESTLNELASSIRQQGLLQPLIVREIDNGRYEIIAGERRWRASQLAGLSEVPVVLRQVDDETAMAMALVENLQREDLNPMDQARAMHRLTTEFALTHQQVADLLSKSRAAVSNYLRLLSLNPEVRRLLEHGDLDMGHARALLILEPEQQSQVAKLVVAQSLSVRETEKLVARVKAGKPEPVQTKRELSPQVQVQLQALSHQLKTKVKINQASSGKGTLVIHYEDSERLQALINELLSQ
ncbi:ParB/RepB/Spo0J family partition protein [Legionella jordanis]|uniref:Probable chromosome-partitioning protein ParB n=1 Tax=Legionella jordanis TaxID=456 RepID=A0A0W0VCF9_9GAMM|nr:ParB/RepB/Spo0J family partition protein [Legionella jordanis]KTD17819.1 chromosome partitioning protein ParB [Legionella jordanis]RMX02478.1 ParB/RepB/Spo0J family partition protein [Legionella jordanis]RMX21679.1 ParB/RepB/Spo0J family partition protein [Legionella jordanis]VEH11244.1 chromosome partitioning protein ParB [Legionella jordanis]HAT8713788.1 ParB/RepB/Spo0J family partition protein [Legionella jordanis]